MILDQQEYRIQISGTHVSEPILIPTPTPLFANPYSLSSNENYAVECKPNHLTLYKLPSRQMIGQFETVVLYCLTIRWRNDETALSFTTEEGRVFIWETHSQVPREVGTGTVYTPAPWSPDGNKILVFVPVENTFVWNLFVVDMNGQSYNTHIEIGMDRVQWYPEFMYWFTNDIIADFVAGSQYTIRWFYDADTGEQLIELLTEIGSNGVQYGQSGRESPDSHWMITERPTYEGPDYLYELLNLTTKQISTLADSTFSYLDFLGWNENSTLFYLLSRPIDATTPPNPSLPSGLLALDPTTRQFTQIIPDAMYATLNAQQTHAFALVPSPLPTGGQLTAALYTLTGNPITTFQPVTDDIPYLTPGEGLPIPAVWSNDGTQIIFSDVWGDLWLADTSGTVIQLVDNLGFDPAYPHQPRFSWSPDDSHLLITFNDRAWVVTLP